MMSNTKNPRIIIIGGGLTALTLAYLLEKEGQSATIIEARDRVGGRIFTKRENKQAPIEMGATWLGKKHTALCALLDELEIGYYEQYTSNLAVYEPSSMSPPQLVQLPPNPEPSHRIEGGSDALIQGLKSRLQQTNIRLNETVKAIHLEDDIYTIHTNQKTYKADIVISTLPPYLLLKTITITPSLPANFKSVATQTHTWMGESIKVGLSFKQPFWRSNRSSGTIFSNVGPITEMYDHSDVEKEYYALKGFMNGAYHGVSREQRLEVILRQLEKYYGAQVRDYIAYEELVWNKETYTYHPYEGYVAPHQNNGSKVFRQPFLNGNFWVGGSETAPHFPGYMEGAVQSANEILRQLKAAL